MILCPNTDLTGALQVASLVQDGVSGLEVPISGGVWRGSLSVGVAERTPSLRRPEELIKAADLGDYAAKSAGRNCIRVGREAVKAAG